MGAGRVSRSTCNVSAERSSMFRGFVGKLLGTAGVAEAALSDVWCAGVLVPWCCMRWRMERLSELGVHGQRFVWRQVTVWARRPKISGCASRSSRTQGETLVGRDRRLLLWAGAEELVMSCKGVAPRPQHTSRHLIPAWGRQSALDTWQPAQHQTRHSVAQDRPYNDRFLPVQLALGCTRSPIRTRLQIARHMPFLEYSPS